MKNISLLFLFTLSSFTLIQAQLTWKWNLQQSVGSPYVTSIAVAPNGVIYVTGFHYDTVVVANTTLFQTSYNSQLFLASFNSDGSTRWVKTTKNNYAGRDGSLAIDSFGNVFWSGNFVLDMTIGDTTLTSRGNWDAFVAKLDTTGNLIWIEQIGGTGADQIFSIKLDNNNGLNITGDFGGGGAPLNCTIGDTTIQSSVTGVFMAKFNQNGDFHYVNTGVDIGNTQGRNVAIDQNGNTYFTGYFGKSFDLIDTLLDNTIWGNQYYFITKYNTNGDLIWVNAGSGNEFSKGNNLIVDSQNDLIFLGDFEGSIILENDTISPSYSVSRMLIKYSPNGEIKWKSIISSNLLEYYLGMITDSLDNIYVYGSYTGDISFDGTILPGTTKQQIFIAKYDSSGTYLWAEHYGEFNNVIPAAMCFSNDYELHMTGLVNGKLSLSGHSVTTTQPEIFVAKTKGLFVGVNEIYSTNEIIVYPNPFSNYTTLSFTGKIAKRTILLYTITGQLVRVIPNSLEKEIIISRGDLPSGIYFYTISSNQSNTVSGKIVID